MNLLDAFHDISSAPGVFGPCAEVLVRAGRALIEASGKFAAEPRALEGVHEVVENIAKAGPRRAWDPLVATRTEAMVWGYLRRSLYHWMCDHVWRQSVEKTGLLDDLDFAAPVEVEVELSEMCVYWDRVIVELSEAARTDDAADRLVEDLQATCDIATSETTIVDHLALSKPEGPLYEAFVKRQFRARKKALAALDAMQADDPRVIGALKQRIRPREKKA